MCMSVNECLLAPIYYMVLSSLLLSSFFFMVARVHIDNLLYYFVFGPNYFDD